MATKKLLAVLGGFLVSAGCGYAPGDQTVGQQSYGLTAITTQDHCATTTTGFCLVANQGQPDNMDVISWLVGKINAEQTRVDINTWYVTDSRIFNALKNKANANIPIRM